MGVTSEIKKKKKKKKGTYWFALFTTMGHRHCQGLGKEDIFVVALILLRGELLLELVKVPHDDIFRRRLRRRGGACLALGGLLLRLDSLLPLLFLFHRHAEGEGKLGVDVRIHTELKGGTTGPSSNTGAGRGGLSLLHQDRGAQQDVAQNVGARRDREEMAEQEKRKEEKEEKEKRKRKEKKRKKRKRGKKEEKT